MMVSVVVATYRRDLSLKNAIASVANQTYNPIEIIVVDDNADVEWNKKVQDIIGQFDNIVYIRNQENQGSAETRNIGIKAAKGKYITFLDDDDIYLPQKIEHQMNAMLNSDADYGITDLHLYNENDVLIDKRIRKYIEKTDTKSLFQYHLMYHITGTDAMIFKKEYLIKIGGFPKIDVGDEFYLMSEAISADGKFVYIPGCFVKAYVHTGEVGLSSGQSKINGENNLFEYKQSFFKDIDRKTQKYIKMRHYAVLAFAYLRMKKHVNAVKEGAKAFFYAPIYCLKLILERK